MSYYLFAGSNYYPEGGVYDFASAAPTRERAEELLQEIGTAEWAHLAVGTADDLKIIQSWTRVPAWQREDGMPGPWEERNA